MVAEQRQEIDALTGLTSRAGGEGYLGAQLALGKPTAVILINLIGFKRVNQRWGHVCGDHVLEMVAHELSTCAKRFPLVCRWDGEKFLIASHSVRSIAEQEVARLRALVSKRYAVSLRGESVEVDISASAGVAVAIDGDSLADLVARVEAGLLAGSN